MYHGTAAEPDTVEVSRTGALGRENRPRGRPRSPCQHAVRLCPVQEPHYGNAYAI